MLCSKLRSRLAPVGLLLLAGFSACYSATEILWIATPMPPPAASGELFHDGGERIRLRARRGDLRFDLLLLRTRDLYAYAALYDARRPFPAAPPPITALRVRVFNEGAQTRDFTPARLRLRGGGSELRPYSLAELDEKIFSAGYSVLHPYWLFGARDSFQFPHPAPDYDRLRDYGAVAPLEQQRERARRLAAYEANLSRAAVLAPGAEQIGITAFPPLSEGVEYVLVYDGAGVQLPEFRFTMRSVRVDRAGAKLDSERTADSARLDELFAEELVERRRELAELYRMHRQLQQHADLRESAESAGARGPERED